MRAMRPMRLTRARPLLGTVVEVTARGTCRPMLEAGIAAAFAAVARVQALMSFHAEDSDVSRLNREASKRAVRVAPETWLVLAAAQRISAASEGAFDVTVAPQLVALGHLPQPAAAWPRPSPHACWQDIELRGGDSVRFHAPLWIDLGGIAKGYAVDLAVAALQQAGVAAGLVNAGGDMRAFGAPERVGVRDPAGRGGLLELGALDDASLATSARNATRARDSGPHVAPRGCAEPGRDAGGIVSVSVTAAECMLADALTKLVLLRGEDSIALLEDLGAAALIIDAAGAARATRRPLLAAAQRGAGHGLAQGAARAGA